MLFFQRISRLKILAVFLLTLIIAVFLQRNSKTELNEEKEFARVEKIIQSKIETVDQTLSEMQDSLDSNDLRELMLDQSYVNRDLYQNEGIVYLGYTGDSLVFWTDNSVPVENYFIDKYLYNNFAKLKNGWYVIRHYHAGSNDLFGLILVKNEYGFQNEFIKSEFFYQYDLDISAKIKIDSEKGYQVKDNDGNYLFSFLLNSTITDNYYAIYFSSLFYLVSLLLFFVITRKLILNLTTEKFKIISLIFLLFLLVGLRYFMLKYHFPAVFRKLDLFQPHHFAISLIIPSLGDLLLHAIFIFFFISLFYKSFSFKLPENKIFIYAAIIFFTIVIFVLSLVINHYLESLILHSSISFEGYKFFDLSIYSLVGYIIIVLFLFSFFLIIDHFLLIIRKKVSLNQFLVVFIPSAILLSFITSNLGYSFEIYSLLFLIVIVSYIAVIRIRFDNYSYPVRIVIILIFALYTVTIVTYTSIKKDRETRKVLAVNLANEHDQVAEMLLVELQDEIENDTIIRDLLTWHHQNEGAILDHLKMTYFSGYFRKYDIEISVCDPYDDLILESENSADIVPCYSFFDDLFAGDGTQLQQSNFYFINNTYGVVSYSGRFTYKSTEWENEVTLFIHLDSKLVNQELGYPELLLDSKLTGSTILSNYSYAKYRDGELMTRFGDFSYQLNLPNNWKQKKEFYFLTEQNFEHLIYNIDDITTIVFSTPKLKFIDVLASFSYIFVFYFMIVSLVFFVIQFPANIKGFRYDFKNKIKFTMIGVLLLSLVIVGFGTIFYNINQFEKNLYESIGEKIQSVLVEMKQKLGGELELNVGYSDYLNYLLINFSNVFYIDINLYDVNGNLLESSRSQVFEEGLMGNKMNVDAFNQMVVQKNGWFIHKESIGDLTYYSAYIPFTNDENTLLAYLNLPYFTKQSTLKKEIYTIVVAVVNIYFFLILLSVIVAIFISNNITKPLQLIQERFREVDLGKQNEPIKYSSNDEIGSLIKEYNRMVSELTENAEKLAKSERESAWREMAKQIAHEIKNPLTPMKLSVQYLQKAWKDGSPDFDKRLEKFSNSLISQINNLSSIATEFSNFAKMPRAQAEQVNIVDKIDESITLFENIKNMQFVKEYNDIDELLVFADKEQVLIVFSNLIQNAIQAIPKGKEGIIKVKVEEFSEHAQISISDNGEGIPEELRPKLFAPNFTTKTSGMGLGLAIVKNIVENAGGKIWYITKINSGTTFYITFPKFKYDA